MRRDAGCLGDRQHALGGDALLLPLADSRRLDANPRGNIRLRQTVNPSICRQDAFHSGMISISETECQAP